MASIVERGTRDAPVWHVKWTVPTPDGKPKQIWKRLHGIRTQKEAKRRLNEIEIALEKGEDPFAKPVTVETMEVLLTRWVGTLTNRNAASDGSMVRRHLIPKWGTWAPSAIRSVHIVKWLDELKEVEKPLSGQTQRHALSTLSRFFGWLSDREEGIVNPVKMLSPASRPTVVHRPREWLSDEAKLADLMAALPYPVDLMLALGNRSGLRLGEICGLRMKDLDYLAKGYITVSHSYGGALKEDDGEETVRREKKVPSPSDAEEVLSLHLKRRKLQGAKAEDLVFMPPKWPRKSSWAGFRREHINNLWWAACKAAQLVDADGRPTVTWYGATRHTMASRAKRDGLGAEQIAEAMGHTDTKMVNRFYFGKGTQRETFAPALRLPMMPAGKKT